MVMLKPKPIKMDLSTQKILVSLDTQFGAFATEHAKHKELVLKAIKWFEDNIVVWCFDENGLRVLLGSIVNVNFVPCRCVGNNLNGLPLCKVEFYVQPIDEKENAGSGEGNKHTVNFKHPNPKI